MDSFLLFFFDFILSAFGQALKHYRSFSSNPYTLRNLTHALFVTTFSTPNAKQYTNSLIRERMDNLKRFDKMPHHLSRPSTAHPTFDLLKPTRYLVSLALEQATRTNATTAKMPSPALNAVQIHWTTNKLQKTLQQPQICMPRLTHGRSCMHPSRIHWPRHLTQEFRLSSCSKWI